MRKLYAFLFTALVLIISAVNQVSAQNYTFTTSAGNAIVPGITLVPGSQGDDLTVLITIPFSYTAYGTAFTTVRASSNGNLQFAGAGNATFTNSCPLPTATTLGFPNFMPQWEDLHTGRNLALHGIFTGLDADSTINEAQTEQQVISKVLVALGWRNARAGWARTAPRGDVL